MDESITKGEAQALARAALARIIKSRTPQRSDAATRVKYFQMKTAAAKILLASESKESTEDDAVAKLMEKAPSELLAECEALGEKLMEFPDEPSNAAETTGAEG